LLDTDLSQIIESWGTLSADAKDLVTRMVKAIAGAPVAGVIGRQAKKSAARATMAQLGKTKKAKGGDMGR
jgi:hypothetical protein